MVRVHPDPPAKAKGADNDVEDLRGCSSVGRAPALQAGGHRFDPVHLHHSEDSRLGAEDRTKVGWAKGNGEGEGGKWVIWSGRLKGWRKSEQRVLWVLCVLPLAVRSEIGCSLKIGKK